MTTIREVARFTLPQAVGKPPATVDAFSHALGALLALYGDPAAVLIYDGDTPPDTVRIGVPVREGEAL